MKESSIQRAIRAKLGAMRIPMFRYQIGTYLASDGSFVHIGEKGVSDLIGMTPYVVKQEDVGRTIAVFTALEVKTAKGRASETQTVWLDAVKRAGGIAIVARSPEDALEALK